MFSQAINFIQKYSASCLSIILCCAVFVSGPVLALSDQALFQHARESYAAKNENALAQDLAELNQQQYLLAPYADYWLMLLRLDKADNEEVQGFLTKYGDYPFAERLRGEWLKKLGKQEDWEWFFDQYPNYKREDVAVQCYALLGKSVAEGVGEDVAAQTRKIWLTTTDLPSSCNPLFDAMQKAGALSADDVWERLRLALQYGKLPLAKSISRRIADFGENNLKLLDIANQSPKALLDDNFKQPKAGRKKAVNKISVSLKTRAGI